jgi:hypothetical protein
MKPMACVLFALICVVAFFWALLELGPSTALVLSVFAGLDAAVSVPLGFLISGVFIAICICKGVRDSMK